MKLYKYRVLITCVPFPYQTTVTARTLESARGKACYEARRAGLDCEGGRVVEYEILSVIETGVDQ